ncbi:hypothetical protein KP509_1Z060800 [Ceratopteris richardii]|nr:hypothetical protein KP509_1Z060800 [Ceratopteris richardii]
MSYLLPSLSNKADIDKAIRDTIDKLAKSARDVSKFASIALVDADAEAIQVYVKYFDITHIPATIFFFNAHHMKMDSGSPDHTKWIGAFYTKQDFIDVVEVSFTSS